MTMHFSFTLYKDTRTSVFSELGLFMGKILNDRGFYCCPIFPDFPHAQKLKIMQILFPVFPTFFDSRRWELDLRDRRAVIFARTQSFNCFISFSLSFLYWPMVVDNSVPLQGAWRHHIRRHWTESSAGGRHGSWKSKQEHRHSSVLWWGQHYWGTEHD